MLVNLVSECLVDSSQRSTKGSSEAKYSEIGGSLYSRPVMFPGLHLHKLSHLLRSSLHDRKFCEEPNDGACSPANWNCAL